MKPIPKTLLLFACATIAGVRGAQTFPGKHWETVSPESAGMASNVLVEFQTTVGGRGCVVRGGRMVHAWGDQKKSSDIASAFKPILTTFLFFAIQEGRIGSVDDRVALFEPRLEQLNGGKDGGITWRHLASQTSGYGFTDAPGAAYSYNDYAITFYYDTLMGRVFPTNATEVLRTRLAEPLSFEDQYSFNAFGERNRPGRLALSVRDMARIGLLYLRDGKWEGKQIVRPELVRLAINSPLPAWTPLTKGVEAGMLPNQRSMGGGKNITPVGPGYYSFNWWLNRTNASGERLFVDAPADCHVASGHGGKRVMVLLPSQDVIAVWNDSRIDDHDTSPGNPRSRNNQALRLLVRACASPP